MTKRVLLASCVAAAALVASPAQAAPYSWTGFYIGANAGGAFGDIDVTGVSNDTNFVDISTGELFAFSPDGVLGGAQLGYNMELSGWLLGIEIEGHGMDFDEITTVAPEPDILSVESEWGATAAVRLGFLVTPHGLIYAKGGYATGNVTTFYFDDSLARQGSFATDETHHGWVAGGGYEHMIGDNVSFGVEYNYIDLGETDHSAVPFLATVPPTTGTLVVNDVQAQMHTVTARLNWHLFAY